MLYAQRKVEHEVTSVEVAEIISERFLKDCLMGNGKWPRISEEKLEVTETNAKAELESQTSCAQLRALPVGDRMDSTGNLNSVCTGSLMLSYRK